MTTEYPGASRLNTVETADFSASGSVVGAFWAPCIGDSSPRCRSRFVAGVEQYGAEGDLSGSFVAYVVGYAASDTRFTFRFANDIDATRIRTRKRSPVTNALLSETAGDRDALHFEVSFEMGFGTDFD
jgi:hypothetical protein